jgi:hypothetical protein
MGKAAREANRLKEQAAIATDFAALATRKFVVAGIEVQATEIATQYGPSQGAVVIFHMADGQAHEAAILDIIGVINLINGVTNVFAQGQGGRPQMAADDLPVGVDGDIPETAPDGLPLQDGPLTVTPSGLILPG